MKKHDRIPNKEQEISEIDTTEIKIPERRLSKPQRSLSSLLYKGILFLLLITFGLIIGVLFSSSPKTDMPVSNSDRTEIPVKEDSDLTVVMWRCQEDAGNLEISLKSFLVTNTYPIASFILINSGKKIDSQISEIVKNYGNLFVITASGQSKLSLIDRAYSMVKSKYVLYLSSDYQMLQDVVLAQIKILSLDQKVIQIWGTQAQVENSKINRDGYIVKDYDNEKWSGFLFTPHVFRMQTYNGIPGGNFSALVNKIFYPSEFSESIVHDYFLSTDYQVVQGEIAFRKMGKPDSFSPSFPEKQTRNLILQRISNLNMKINHQQEKQQLKKEETNPNLKEEQIEQKEQKEQEEKSTNIQQGGEQKEPIETQDVKLDEKEEEKPEKQKPIKIQEVKPDQKQEKSSEKQEVKPSQKQEVKPIETQEVKLDKKEEEKSGEKQEVEPSQKQEQPIKKQDEKADQKQEEKPSEVKEGQNKNEETELKWRFDSNFTRNIPIDLNSNLTVVMLTCCGKHQQMVEVINSFLDLNTYPIAGFIVINDDYLPSSKFLAVTRQYGNLTTIVTGAKVGQLYAIDMVYSMVKTEYVFYLEDDFKMLKDVARTYIDIMDQNPKVLQIWGTPAVPVNITKDGYIAKTASHWSGFSFNSHIFRMSVYKSILGGSFSALTEYVSFGLGAGNSEIIIHDYFLVSDYEVVRGEVVFKHLRDRKGSARYYAPKGTQRKFIVHDPVLGQGKEDAHNQDGFLSDDFLKKDKNHKSNQNQKDFPKNIHLDLGKNLTVVMLTCCGNYENTVAAVDSFLNSNSYPIAHFIIVNDGIMSPQLLQVVKKFKNITILNTGIPGGELFAIDMAYSMVRTPYVFYLQDGFKMVKDVAKDQISLMEKDPKIIQIQGTQGDQAIVTSKGYIKKSLSSKSGFTLTPHVFKMQIYKDLPGGSFTALTSSVSFGIGAGDAEILIQDHFLASEYETVHGEVAFVEVSNQSYSKQYEFPSDYKRNVLIHDQEP